MEGDSSQKEEASCPLS